MALPQDNRFINQVVASTREHARPYLVDALFKSNALFARLYGKGKVVIDGGEEIRIPFMYDRLPGGWYSGLGPFAIQQKEILTSLRFDWKQVYRSITLPGIDIAKNMGPHRLFDLVAAQLSGARMSISDDIGTELYNDGSDVNKITGLRLATSNTGTYGKIARGAGAIADAIEGNVDTTGGSVTLPFINSLMGTASAGGAEKPDLLMTTQVLWDAVWARVQPQQRYVNKDDFAGVGFDSIRISSGDLVADDKCPSGYLFGLNTNYCEFYVMEGYDFYVRGPFELQTQDGFTAQVVMYLEMAISNPRLNFQASGLTA
ncbi:MAG TPA: phage major capsid protein [Streptosporangiaceae bacterium]